MSSYLIIWEFEAEASTPRQAAQFARDAQTEPDTWATVFDCKDIGTGEITRVDLMNDDDSEDYVVSEGSTS